MEAASGQRLKASTGQIPDARLQRRPLPRQHLFGRSYCALYIKVSFEPEFNVSDSESGKLAAAERLANLLQVPCPQRPGEPASRKPRLTRSVSLTSHEQLYNLVEPARKIVADTSAVLAVCLEEKARQEVIEHTKGTELIAPESLPFEVPNALSSKFRQGKLDLGEALKVIERFEKIPIQYARVDLQEATRLAHNLGIYAYDAYMIEAARRHNCPIISLDGGLCEAAGRADVDTIKIIP